MIGLPSRAGLLRTVGEYELLECVGEGGMGLVFRARHPRASGDVALKILRASLVAQPKAVAYFLKEARHLQGLAHPHIMPVIEFGQTATGAFLVMPYMERGSLAGLLQKGCPLEPQLIQRLASQVASALAFAHGHSIIHRDLKPRNILIDATGNAVLSDFGLAQSLWNDELVDVRQRLVEGTPQYLSPAAARGESEDTRGDIYALGALLYEMLAGRPPYVGQSREDILPQIVAGPPQPIAQANPEAPPALVTIAEGAMARELCDRYAHMSYVVVDLERVASGAAPLGPHAQRGQPPSERTGSLGSGRKWLLAAAVAAVAVAVGAWLFERRPDPLRKREPPPVMSLGKGLLQDKPPPPTNTHGGLCYWYEIETAVPEVLDWSKAKVGPWRVPGEASIFVIVKERLLMVSDEGQVLWEWPRGSEGLTELHLDLVEDFDGDDSDEAVVGWRAGTNLHLAVVNQKTHVVKRFSALGSEAKPLGTLGGGSHMIAVGVLPLKPGGPRSLLAVVTTGCERQPRGLYCFDFENESLLWSNSVASPAGLPGMVAPFDPDADGTLEVLCGSMALHNGYQAEDGTDDSHAYLNAFTAGGTRLWREELGGPYMTVHPIVADLDGDGQPELLALVSGDHQLRAQKNLPETGALLRIDPRTGATIGAYTTNLRLLSCEVARLTPAAKPQILLTDRLGFLHVLDDRLLLQRRVQVVTNRYEYAYLQIVRVADLDGDGRDEIVLTSSQYEHLREVNPGQLASPFVPHNFHENVVIVLDADLAPVARYLVEKQWKDVIHFGVQMADFDGDGRPEVVVLTDKVTVLKYAGPEQ
jgi:serine/threonine protein kinase